MGSWLWPINVQIARCLGQNHLHTLEWLVDFDLASQPRSACESKCKVKQIFLLIASCRQFTEYFLGKDDVAGGAGQTGLTCPFQLHIIIFGYLQKMLTFFRLDILLGTIPFDEGEADGGGEEVPEMSGDHS